MSTKANKKSSKEIQLYLIMAVFLGVGYYFLEHVSAMEDPILGNTFYIVVGCVLIAIPVVVAIKTISDKMKRKKKSRARGSSRNRRVFLADKKETKN